MSDSLARKERENFERKQTARLKGKANKDIGSNYHLGAYFDECKPKKHGGEDEEAKNI